MSFLDAVKNVFGMAPPARGVAKEAKQDEGFTPTPKDPEVIATRFVLLVLVTQLADSVALERAGGKEQAVAMRKATLDHLVELGFGPGDLEPSERDFVMSLRSGRVDPAATTAATWRLECAAVLAWALGLRDSIPSEEEGVELEPLLALVPDDREAFAAFAVSTTRTRALAALMTEYRAWMMRMLPLEPQPPSETRSRVIERFRALMWLTNPHETELSSVEVVSRGG